jgi:thiamine biosynthesis protein ThiC
MYKDLFRADTVIIKRALRQYVKNNLIELDEKSTIDRIIKELDKPDDNMAIYAEITDHMLEHLLQKYTLVDEKGNIVS